MKAYHRVSVCNNSVWCLVAATFCETYGWMVPQAPLVRLSAWYQQSSHSAALLKLYAAYCSEAFKDSSCDRFR